MGGGRERGKERERERARERVGRERERENANTICMFSSNGQHAVGLSVAGSAQFYTVMDYLRSVF